MEPCYHQGNSPWLACQRVRGHVEKDPAKGDTALFNLTADCARTGEPGQAQNFPADLQTQVTESQGGL